MKRLLVALLLAVACFLVACGQDSIEPQLTDISTQIDGGKLIITLSTNLPDGTALDALIFDQQGKGKYISTSLVPERAYESALVREGKLKAYFPTASKEGLSGGVYWVEFVTLPDQKAVLGEGNERLAGAYVEQSKLGKGFVFKQQVSFPTVPAPPAS